MEQRIRPTRSGLFAIELLIAVGVFTLCAAICVGMFVKSEVMSQDSADLNRAVSEARSVAECFKAAGGDLERTIELAEAGWVVDGSLFRSYDGDWNRLSRREPQSDSVEIPTFYLTLEPRQAAGYAGGTLAVYRNGEREPLLSWNIAALPEAEP